MTGCGCTKLYHPPLTVLNDLYKTPQVRQHSAAHQDADLLYNLDTGVTSLPRLLTAADGLEEGQQAGNAEGGGDDCKRSSRRVTHILVHVVDVRPHCRDHSG